MLAAVTFQLVVLLESVEVAVRNFFLTKETDNQHMLEICADFESMSSSTVTCLEEQT